MIVEHNSREIYTMSITELINVIADVMETADQDRWNSEDVEIAIRRTNEKLQIK